MANSIGRTGTTVVALAALAILGCASIPENDPVLDNARLTVNAARNNPQVATYASVEASQAAATLREAEEVSVRPGGINEAHRLAVLASQQATLAQQVAQTRSEGARLAVQRAAQDAQIQADASRRQAEAAQAQAAAAQRQAEEAQRQAAAIQYQTLNQAIYAPAAVDQRQLADISAYSARGPVVTLYDDMFEPRAAQLRPDAMDKIQRIGSFLMTHPDRVVAIEGFADTSGNATSDRRLSEQRAAAVQAAIVATGVAQSRTVIRGYGEAYPIASNATAEGRRLNRRVEIIVSESGYSVPPRG